MSNLLTETIEAINHAEKSIEDIMFIGSEESGHSCTWAQFKVLANNDYDSGFGAPEVAEDLIIVFKDGQKMWRSEYDGSEWWAFYTPFKKPENQKGIKSLFAKEIGWETLETINED